VTRTSGTASVEVDARPGPLVSAVVSLLSLAGGLSLLYGVLEEGPSGALLAVDVAVGVVCSAALWWRHRAPVPIAVGTAVAASVFATAGAANMFALYAVARRRPLPTALVLALVNVAAGLVFYAVYPGNNALSLTVTVNVAISAAAVAWGALARSQRRLVRSLEERAVRAESEQQLRADQIRSSERSRIAREMHDVVAHRVSLVALHAGGLEVQRGLAPGEVHEAARLIRRSAQDALDELRMVVGALREDAPAAGGPPSLSDLEPLVADSRAAGQPVQLDLDVPAGAEPPPWLGRTAYRVVQEAITNAIKHAPGAATTISVTGRPGEGLVVVVRNALDRRIPSAGLVGSGAGLLGLTERVTLAGGEFEHGTSAEGEFSVRAELPWPTSRQPRRSGSLR
jgi:signal transduction histidine kinase